METAAIQALTFFFSSLRGLGDKVTDFGSVMGLHMGKHSTDN